MESTMDIIITVLTIIGVIILFLIAITLLSKVIHGKKEKIEKVEDSKDESDEYNLKFAKGSSTESKEDTKIAETEKDIEKPKQPIDGYISRICAHGKMYAIKAEVTEVYPISCPKCGASFELHHGEGQCPYCHTNYTTMYKVVES